MPYLRRILGTAVVAIGGLSAVHYYKPAALYCPKYCAIKKERDLENLTESITNPDIPFVPIKPSK